MTSEIEALAQQLERHPDYKVLRRLTHASVFNPALANNKLCRGVVLDTETTGFDPQHDKVIELGMLLFDFDSVTGEIHKVLDVFDELEDPGFPIPPATIAVHHITDEMVHGQQIDDTQVNALLKNVVQVYFDTFCLLKASSDINLNHEKIETKLK